ncbi:hypothetical protein K469DRAFT_734353 [Zopfia rhizophila CBS 207.26]|uniref:Pathway-specific nitrogen regulator n=1 Tax=Zopfia rhizophila CBS 207.26 TaxID=1314779 RepID=A0A6A6EQL5_9PEZI|nr:hypothetical protein K469DRAFT_734353 [Zopfia rhizophila CBS 207.26]
MTTIHHSPPPGTTPFAIYEDPEDQEPPSPSEAYEGDTSFNSEISSLLGADEPIPSIEHEHESEDDPEPYNSSYTSRHSNFSSTPSRRVSGVTTTSLISSLPSELSITSKPIPPPGNGLDSRYTPKKERPPFRNPSSVRAMQMASSPPFAAFENPRDRLKGPYKLTTPCRSGRSDTPVSASGSRRAGSHRGSHRDSQAHVQQSPRPTPTPQQHYPLVLLHVTILPLQMPYAHDVMAKAMPDWLLENYKLLEGNLKDIVLMRRGLLIPHPREEYDVLEERILESLELKTPRLLKCGHFVGSENESEEHTEDEDEKGSVADDVSGRGSSMSGGTITVDDENEWKYLTPEADDASICTDCHRQVKRPGKGIGIGRKRWDIKIYAANGLMRAGAWSAAWSEMERCDVEITPWIPEDVRKAVEKKVEEDREAEKQRQIQEAEIQRRVDEEGARIKKIEDEAEEKQRLEEAELQRKLEEEEALEAQALADAAARFRLLEEKLEKEQQSRSTPHPPPLRNQSRGRPRPSSPHRAVNEIPLGTVLRNYILLLAQDQRNIAIIALSVFVVFLSMHMGPRTPSMDLPSPSLPNTVPGDHLPDPVSSVVITTTATTTATSISTLIVTQVEHQADNSQETSIPPTIETPLGAEDPSPANPVHSTVSLSQSKDASATSAYSNNVSHPPSSSPTSLSPPSSSLSASIISQEALSISSSAAPSPQPSSDTALPISKPSNPDSDRSESDA